MKKLLILLALIFSGAASAQTVSTRGPYIIEDYYRLEDGNNWAPALQRAQEMWMIPATGNPSTDRRRYYTAMRTVVFGTTRDVYPIVGDADGYGVEIQCNRPSVVLSIPAGSLRFHRHRYFTGAGGSHASGYGGPSRLTNCTVTGSRTATVAYDGVVSTTGVEIEDSVIQNFSGRGVVIDSDHHRADMSNSNLFGMERVDILNNGSHGLYINGADANAGHTSRVRAERNNGWGIWDSSFLGNTHDAPALVLNGTGPRDKNQVPAVQLAMLSDYVGANTVVINPYVEGFDATMDLPGQSIVIAGAGGLYTSRTRRIRGGSMSGDYEFRGPGGRVGVGSSVVLALGKIGASRGTNFTFELSPNGLDIEVGGVNAQRAFTVTGTTASVGARKLAPGRMWIPGGYYEGPGAVRRILGVGVPTALEAEVGAIYTRSDPVAGQPFQWVGTRVGTITTWKILSSIAP